MAGWRKVGRPSDARERGPRAVWQAGTVARACRSKGLRQRAVMNKPTTIYHPETSPFAIALREELRAGSLRSLATAPLGDLEIEVCTGRDSVWVLVRRPGKGALALRAAYVPVAGFDCRKLAPE